MSGEFLHTNVTGLYTFILKQSVLADSCERRGEILQLLLSFHYGLQAVIHSTHFLDCMNEMKGNIRP